MNDENPENLDETEDDIFPASPVGRRPTLPGILEGVEQVQEFNPMLELFGAGDDEFGVDRRTEVTDMETLQISRGRFLSAYFRIPELNEWIDSILRLKISRHRKSRQEAVEAVRAMHGISHENTIPGLLDRLRK